MKIADLAPLRGPEGQLESSRKQFGSGHCKHNTPPK